MTIELFESKADDYYVIKDGDAILRLTKKDFDAMKKVGMSPLLKKLWDQAKAERAHLEDN